MDSIKNRQHHPVKLPPPPSQHHQSSPKPTTILQPQYKNLETNSEIDTTPSVDIGERHASVSEQLVPSSSQPRIVFHLPSFHFANYTISYSRILDRNWLGKLCGLGLDSRWACFEKDFAGCVTKGMDGVLFLGEWHEISFSYTSLRAYRLSWLVRQ